MTEELRVRLREEMACHDGMPVAELVAGAVQQGRGARRARRVASRVATLGVMALTVGAAVLGGRLNGGSTAPAQQAAAGHPVTLAVPKSVAPTAPAARITAPKKASADRPKAGTRARTMGAAAQADAATPAVSAPGVAATTGGVLQLLSEQLDTLGRTGQAGVGSDDPLHVQLYLTTAAGTGMVRVDLHQSEFTPALCLGLVKQPTPTVTCTTNAAGDYVVTYDNAYEHNCTETQSVQVIHPDGSEVDFYLATCLGWDGTQNAASPQAITAGQAAAFGADPRWDLSMSPDLVAAGARNFPSPAPMS